MNHLKLYEDFRILEDVPKYFYLVVNIKRAWESLIKMKFVGLKGISDNPNIINSFFDVRDTLLVIDAQKVLEQNPDMFKIDYDNPHQLVSNNFEILNRLLQNKTIYYSDIFAKLLRRHTWSPKYRQKQEKYQKLFDATKYLERNSYNLGELFSKYENDIKINNLHDLAKWILDDALPMVEIENRNNLPYGTQPYDLNDLSYNQLYFILQENIFDLVKHWKENEGEWIIKKDPIKQETIFKIPEGSDLYFKLAVDTKDPEETERYKNKFGLHGLDSDTYSGQENSKLIQDLIENYDLENKYNVKYIKGYMKAHDIFKQFPTPITKSTYKPMRNPYYMKPGRKPQERK